MIRNQWYAVLESKEVKSGRLTGVQRMGERLVFWRKSDGSVVCMRDQCPHLGAKLSQGRLMEDQLACPFHGFQYDSTGSCVYLPAYGSAGDIPKGLRVVTYPAYEAHGFIWIFWGEPEQELQSPKFFDIDESFSYDSFHEFWPVHYSRMIENQLDVMHLPFVHYNSIGRGGRKVVDGPLYELKDDLLSIWVYNRLDDGTPPRKPEQISPPQRAPFLQFRFPNIWQNRISDDFRILAAFVPVDEENSVIYLRFYQRVMRVPVIRNLFNLVGNWSNRYILHQDRRVVLQQRPIKTELKKMGEKLTQGDRLILAYRTRRHKLKVESGQIEE